MTYNITWLNTHFDNDDNDFVIDNVMPLTHNALQLSEHLDWVKFHLYGYIVM